MNNNKNTIIKDIKKYSNEAILASVIEYKGTKSIDMKHIRQEFNKNNIIIKVAKNKLASIALKNTVNDKLIPDLNQQNLLIFSTENINLPLKLITNYIKNNKGNFKVKSICLYRNLINKEEINTIINLPNKETAMYNLIMVLKQPIKNIINLLQLPYINLVNLIKLKK